MTETEFNTPILFLIFNRPEETFRVFEKISEIKPAKLYIASDGTREYIQNEIEIVEDLRKNLIEKINWKCEIKTLFRNKNLGCKFAVSSAIDWFFENEEQGIILEDDILPDLSFFRYCSQLLELFKDNEQVMQINGYNPVNFETENSYIFSKYGTIWGWATWRRAWKLYDVEMKEWQNVRNNPEYDYFYLNKKEKKIRQRIFDKVFNNEIDTWDYQWAFAKLLHKGISIFPVSNLIQNIGFHEKATHTKVKPKILNKAQKLHFPISHPQKIEISPDFDRKYFRTMMSPGKISLIVNKIKSLF